MNTVELERALERARERVKMIERSIIREVETSSSVRVLRASVDELEAARKARDEVIAKIVAAGGGVL